MIWLLDTNVLIGSIHTGYPRQGDPATFILKVICKSMFEKIRDKMRHLIRSLDYVMTIHGAEEMENDKLSILDVENAVLTGEIIERQRDENSAESKYLVMGKTLDDLDITVVAKLGPTGKLFIITVYSEEDEYEN